MPSYSKIERRIYSDEKVRRWNRDTRDVWIYLLANQHMDTAGGKLGMYVLDPAYIAADLSTPDHRWTVEATLAELLLLQEQGRILYDPDVRLVLVRNFLAQQQNHPDNPNVAKHAALDLDEIPYSETLWVTLREGLISHCRMETEKGQPWCSIILDAVNAAIDRASGNAKSSGDATQGSANTSTLPKGLPEPFPKGSRVRAQRTEPEPEPDKKKRKPPSGGKESSTAPAAPDASRSKERLKARPIPKAWKPNDAHAALAGKLELSVDDEAAAFRDHALAHGRTLKDWNAGFRAWLRKAKTFNGPRGSPSRKGPQQFHYEPTEKFEGFTK